MNPAKVRCGSTSRLKFILLALFCIFLWGSAIPCVKLGYPLFGLENGTPYDRVLFAGVRFSGAGLITLLIARLIIKKPVRLQRRNLLPAMGLGLIQTTGQYVCFYIGLANAPGARTAILNTVSTFLTVFLAPMFFREEKLRLRSLIGCLVGFSGIVLVNLGGDLSGGFRWDGDFLIIVASLFFALGSLTSKRLSLQEDPFALSGVQLFFGGLVLTAVGLLGGGHLGMPPFSGWLLLMYLIALSAAAFSIWTYLLRDHSAASVSIYFFLLPVFGVTLSGLMLGERVLTLSYLAALAFVSAGIYIVNREPRASNLDTRPAR